jgi:uncharacterized protein (DUF433 family)
VPHVHHDERGRAWIDDSNVKVIEIVMDHLAYGWNAETIQENHPHLSLAQVYAALAWYYDRQAELDAAIEQQGERLCAFRATPPPVPAATPAGRLAPGCMSLGDLEALAKAALPEDAEGQILFL